MHNSSLRNHLAFIPDENKERPIVAFFDLDRTLIAGYSILMLAKAKLSRGTTDTELRETLHVITQVLQTRKENDATYHRLVRTTARSLKGVAEATLIELGEEAFRRDISNMIYAEAIAIIEAHRAAGHHLVIVTAASRYQVEPVARALGIDNFCCSKLLVADGVFSGETESPLCYGEGKTFAAQQVCADLGAKLTDAWFYTDSSDDLPLLERVGNPVAANPSAELEKVARQRLWKILNFTSRGRPTRQSMLHTAATLGGLTSFATLGSVSSRLGIPEKLYRRALKQLLGNLGSALAGLTYEIDGADNLIHKGPAIYIINHQSLLDAVVVARLLDENVVPLVKSEIQSNPVIGPLLRQAGTIFVDRANPNPRDDVRKAMGVLANGSSLLIAPEGTRSQLGEIAPFKRGAFMLARKSNVPVIPLVLHNVKDALPRGGIFIRPAKIRVSAFPALYPSDMKSADELCSKLESLYCDVLQKSDATLLPYPVIKRLRERTTGPVQKKAA